MDNMRQDGVWARDFLCFNNFPWRAEKPFWLLSKLKKAALEDGQIVDKETLENACMLAECIDLKHRETGDLLIRMHVGVMLVVCIVCLLCKQKKQKTASNYVWWLWKLALMHSSLYTFSSHLCLSFTFLVHSSYHYSSLMLLIVFFFSFDLFSLAPVYNNM